MRGYKSRFVAVVMAVLICIMPITSFAENGNNEKLDKDNSYQIGALVNAGFSDGFKKDKEIKKKDPHYGWDLGDFYISNYTDKEIKDGKVVFIKNVGDKVTLWFDLEQDINALNGNEKLSVAYDKDNYDERLETDNMEFGRGALFIRYINTNNKKDKVKAYKNYLEGVSGKKADTKVRTFEEGDYEVVLDYTIKKTNINGNVPVVDKEIKTASTHHNYRVCFKFSVRNGNCMSYPIDLNGKGELANNGYASKGFRIDFAKSKAVKVKVKREIVSGNDSLDVRFSRPAKDGEEFVEPGIYTITTTNRLTKDKTVKKIYVGKDYYNKANKTGSGKDSMDNPAVMDQIKSNVYQSVVNELNSKDYFVENVATEYYSKEYINEVAYNSQPNMYFGYTLPELEKQFKGKKYIFTVGDDGQTIVTTFKKGDDTYEKAMKNVAIGTGVILICVTVSVATGGTAPAVSMIFMASAKTGTAVALSSGAIGAAAAGITTGINNGNVEEVMKSSVKSGSESFMWGAIGGTLIGGASEYAALKGAALNGLTVSQAALIQKDSKYPLNIIKSLRSKEEYEVYKNIGLTSEKVGKKNALVRKIDPSRIDENGLSNIERMRKGRAPLDASGEPYQLHHIGQTQNSPLAILTKAEHRNNNSILHSMEKGVDHGKKWRKQRKQFWKAFANNIENIN